MTSQTQQVTLLATALLLIHNASFALNTPPQEAISACNNNTENSSCSIQTPNDQITGSCLNIQAQLACVPDSGPNSPGNVDNVENDTPSDNNDNTTQSSQNNTSNTSSDAISLNSNDTSLHLPSVSVDDSVFYSVDLYVVSSNPLTLQLSNAEEINTTSEPNANYDSQSETLTIPSLNLNGQLTTATFKRNNLKTQFQLEIQSTESASYNLVDTGQTECYSSSGNLVNCSGMGQDGSYTRNAPSYTNNGDGTVNDNISGLMWQNTPDSNSDGTINSNDKMTQSQASSYCNNLVLGNYSDWRLPDIKTLYSLINFDGEDPFSDDTSGLTPFIDNNYFEFAYGDTSAGERVIDMQYATSTNYVSSTMNGNPTMFGVNLADGRIKGYGTNNKTFAVQCVRDQANYGVNSFTNNNDGTISDTATGLMWERNDSQSGMDWDAAISYCESSASGGYTDWQLPNAKELQSIVDYSRSPDTTNSAAIDSIFNATSIINEAGQSDWGYYWSSTTHKNGLGFGSAGVYVTFGRALGYMNNQWMDVHGAGAQRSNAKVDSGQSDPNASVVIDANGNEAIVFGPQGDVTRYDNFVRCVRSDS